MTDWQDIETAEPKDSARLLVATSEGVVGEAWWRPNFNDVLELWWAGESSGDYHADTIVNGGHRVTHWAPLPEPPRAPLADGDKSRDDLTPIT